MHANKSSVKLQKHFRAKRFVQQLKKFNIAKEQSEQKIQWDRGEKGRGKALKKTHHPFDMVF
jgi:hypothetical protein